MDYATQDEVDLAFADLDSLLAKREPEGERRCRGCGGTSFERGCNAGMAISYYDVCISCGCIDEATSGRDDNWITGVPRSTSNYKRIHHWHERISQLLLLESQIPNDHFLQIAEKLLSGQYTVLNKDVIRSVLRSLNMQLYIEKWLQIIQRCTGIEPPKPGAQMLNRLDENFLELQQPFSVNRVKNRKNFLNYNYVFCRLFQRIGCTQFCMFFPLIKSRAKLKLLDEMYTEMAQSVGWEVTSLQHVPPFAVKLEQPDLLLRQIRQRVASATPAETSTSQTKTGYRKSDLRLLRELDRQRLPKRRRSSQPEPELQKLGSSVKRPRSAVATKLQQSLRLASQR